MTIRSFRSFLAFVIALVLGLFLLVPWTTTGHPVNTLGDVRVDLSFILSMPWFLERKLQFGSDLVFTYGPLGVLSGNVVPARWLIPILAARGALAALFVAGWWSVTSGAPRGVRTLGLLNCFALSFLSWEQYFWVAFPLFGAITALRGTTPGILVGLLAFASAAIGFVKFNFFVSSGICYGTVALLTLAGRVRQKWTSLVWCAGVITLWCALGQAPLGLVSWVSACLDLSAGYGEAMAKGFFAPYDGLDVTLVGVGSIVLLWLVGASLRRSALSRLVACGLGGVLVLFVYLAHRHAWGGNQLEQAVSVLVFTTFIAAALGGRGPELQGQALTRRSRVVVLAALAMFWFASWRNCLFLVVPPAHALEKLTAAANAVRELADGKPALAGEARERAFDAIRAMFPEFLKMHGTADAMPDQGAVLLAYPDVIYTPRPAYLSLNAHTEALVMANADFFASDRAPKNLLYEIVPPAESVHHRLPASLDGLALRTILQSYRLHSLVGPLAWLERDRRPPWRSPLVSIGPIELGQRVPIPAGAVLWAQLAIRKTSLGAVVDQVYKLPQIEVRYHGAGRDESWQILPRVAAKGFFVAPRLAKTKEVLQLQEVLEKGTAAADQGFTSFEIRQQDGPSGLWQAQLGLTLETWLPN